MRIVKPLEAYEYYYDHGHNFPKDWYITDHFTWNEAFTGEKIGDGWVDYRVFVDIGKLAGALEQCRRAINKPFIVHCWVRTIPHNKRAGSMAKRSPHIFGMGVDFHVQGMKEDAARKKMLTLGLNIRIEDGTVGWIHVDIGNPFIPRGMSWGLFKA